MAVSPFFAARFSRFWARAVVCCSALALAGCGKEDGIHSYVIPKPETVALNNPPVAGSSSPEQVPPMMAKQAPKPDYRMLCAIVPRGSRTWFFKMVGPNASVESQAEKFVEFVGSLQIGEGDDAKPAWKLPAGWSETSGGQMRYATVAIDSPGDPIDFSVTVLATGAGDLNEFILSNVNRWRTQMSLPPTDKAALFADGNTNGQSLQRTINGMSVTLLNLMGTYTGGMSAAPFAGGARGPAGPPPMAAHGPAASGDLKYDVPAGWKPGKGSSFSAAAFDVNEGAGEVHVTVTPLPSSGVLPNVNRWRDQLQLEPVDEKQLAAQTTNVPAGSHEGHFVELSGTGKQSKKPEIILGVIVEQGGRSWFFKLQGDAELAQREKAKFLEFVKSVRFE